MFSNDPLRFLQIVKPVLFSVDALKKKKKIQLVLSLYSKIPRFSIIGKLPTFEQHEQKQDAATAENIQRGFSPSKRISRSK